MKTKYMLIITFLTLSVSANSAEYYQSLNLSYNKINGQFSNLLALDVYTPQVGKNFPVVVFVHGGGWVEGDKSRASHHNKRDFFIDHGYIFVSINYRLAPDVGFPVYAEDVAQALAFVFNWIGKYKGNPHKVYLMGHSAGAHLAALVATDEKYLQPYHYSPSDIKAVILLDGAGYDIPATIAFQSENNPSAVNTYYNAFGSNEKTWIDASPINHVNELTPPHLLFYVDTRQVSYLISSAYAERLNHFNSSQVIAVSHSSHHDINVNFGASSDVVSQQALTFMLDL